MDYEISADALLGLTAVIAGAHCVVLDEVEAQAFIRELTAIRQCWQGPGQEQAARAVRRATGRDLFGPPDTN